MKEIKEPKKGIKKALLVLSAILFLRTTYMMFSYGAGFLELPKIIVYLALGFVIGYFYVSYVRKGKLTEQELVIKMAIWILHIGISVIVLGVIKMIIEIVF